MYQFAQPIAIPAFTSYVPVASGQPGIATTSDPSLAWPFTAPFSSQMPISYLPVMPQPIYQTPLPLPYAGASAAATAGLGGAFASAAAGIGGYGGYLDPYASAAAYAGLGGGVLGGYDPYAAAYASAYASPYGASAFAGAGTDLLGSLLGKQFGSVLGGQQAGGIDSLLYALLSLLMNQPAATSIPGLTSLTTSPQTLVSEPKKLVTVDVPKGNQNLTWGDPHFEYYDAEGKLKKYDFQGQANKWFTLVKDGSLEMNSHFKAYGNDGATVMDKLGFTIDGTKVSYDANGTPKISGRVSTDGGETFQTVDNIELEDGKEYVFESGVQSQDGTGELKASVKWDKKSNSLDVVTGEYHFVAKKDNDYIRLLSATTSAGVYANGKGADGVLGRAFNPDFVNFGKNGKQGANAQGEGFLDRDMAAYIADGQFDGADALKEDDVKAVWGRLAQNKDKAATAN